MDRCEKTGKTDSEEYLAAVDVFYKRHFCRTDPWPDYLLKTFDILNEQCYVSMWGPNEFTCNGYLREYDGSSELSQISVPTLVTCGEFDEATPASCREWTQLIPKAELLEFKDASHLAFIEDKENYLKAVDQFLGQS